MSIPIAKMVTVGILPSFLKVLYYKALGAKVGKRVKFAPFSVINSKSIVLGDDVKLGLFTFINADSVNMGNRSKINSMTAVDTGKFTIGADSIIMEQVVIGGMKTSRSELKIGKRVKIFPFSFINPTEKIEIEDEVGVGGSNYIFTHGTWPSMLDGYPGSFGPVTIKKGVWLPWRVFILPNVTIGENSIIAAGSVVNKDVGDKKIAAGMPAKTLDTGGKHIKEMSEDKKHDFLLEIFEEFVDFKRYEGEKISFNSTDCGCILKLKKGNIVYTKVFEENAKPSVEATLLISLSSIPSVHREKFVGKSGWYDLYTKESELCDNPYWQETRDFFSRYGIRFNILE